MIQQTIDLAGWQQFVSAAEVTAAVVALIIGWAGTEALKRLAQALGRHTAPAWVYPLTAFLLTLTASVGAWPVGGRFPHPWIAGLALAAAAPTIYTTLIWGLRRAGLDGLASAITGNRRRADRGGPRGVDRREEGR